MWDLQAIVALNQQRGGKLSAQRAIQLIALFQEAGGSDAIVARLISEQGQKRMAVFVKDIRDGFGIPRPKESAVEAPIEAGS